MPVSASAWALASVGRGHLAALHLADPAMGVEDEDIDTRRARETPRSPPSRCRRWWRPRWSPARPAGQRRLEQLADQLHGEILEGQRRPVEQLQQEMVRLQLLQRRAGGMAEAGIGARDQLANSSSVKASPMKGRITRNAASS
jgi:hypothetical protein